SPVADAAQGRGRAARGGADPAGPAGRGRRERGARDGVRGTPARDGGALRVAGGEVSAADETRRRMSRWRLVLGEGTEDTLGGLSDKEGQCDRALGFLYGREYGPRRNVRGGRGGGRKETRAGPAITAASANPTSRSPSGSTWSTSCSRRRPSSGSRRTRWSATNWKRWSRTPTPSAAP